MKKIDDQTFVAGQIRPEDIDDIKASGVAMIVNNRPDDEEPAQPRASQIEAAARAAGLDYRNVPVASGLSADLVRNMAEALEAADGPVLAFCRSGTRSTYLWALARSQMGDEPEALMRKAEAAGYDLSPIQRFL